MHSMEGSVLIAPTEIPWPSESGQQQKTSQKPWKKTMRCEDVKKASRKLAVPKIKNTGKIRESLGPTWL